MFINNFFFFIFHNKIVNQYLDIVDCTITNTLWALLSFNFPTFFQTKMHLKDAQTLFNLCVSWFYKYTYIPNFKKICNNQGYSHLFKSFIYLFSKKSSCFTHIISSSFLNFGIYTSYHSTGPLPLSNQVPVLLQMVESKISEIMFSSPFVMFISTRFFF